jgi:NAD(P)-dependent dehydrogenase (short-subunit alcohol dehydrogenase family)
MQVNLVSSFNIVKAAVKGMIKEEGQQQHQQSGATSTSSSPGRRGGGSIVLVSAALASHGIPNYEAMSAAKAAVEGKVQCSKPCNLMPDLEEQNTPAATSSSALAFADAA